MNSKSIYAYTTPVDREVPWQGERQGGRGRIKIGETTGDVDDRIKQQFGTANSSGREYVKVFEEPALREDGSEFSDKDIIRALIKAGVRRPSERKDGAREWFEVTLEEIRKAYEAVRLKKPLDLQRENYSLRPEQEEAIVKTIAAWEGSSGGTKRFLWNAKMRFGKCFTALQLAKRLGARRILILTYMPMVEDSWEAEIRRHVDFRGWKYVPNEEDWEHSDVSGPMVVFCSFQKLRSEEYGQDRVAALKKSKWDLLLVDEQHYGVPREDARERLRKLCGDLNVTYQLELSGTPFRDIGAGTFAPEEVFEWSYIDEQRAKQEYEGSEPNPYKAMPRMSISIYQLGDDLREQVGEREWTLDEMFRVQDGKFVHEGTVEEWLDVIQGKKGQKRGDARSYPYERRSGDGPAEIASLHSVWFFKYVDQCNAMEQLLDRAGGFFDSVKVVNASGSGGDDNFIRTGSKEALRRVRAAIRENERTVTLTCGMLLTGVTVSEWGTIGMLYDGKSATKYLQAAFRVQSPWIVNGDVKKPVCHVFDFDPNRCLNVLVEQAESLARGRKDGSLQNSVADFVDFMDVVWHVGGKRQVLDANMILQYASEGIGSRYLARRWNDDRMVNAGVVWGKLGEDVNLQRILDKVRVYAKPAGAGAGGVEISSNPELAKKPKGNCVPGSGEGASGGDERVRKQIQDKLKKVIASIPMFMYLTPDRESTLLEVIQQSDESAFQELTGLTLADFDALVEAGAFNEKELNKAVRYFRGEELSSLGYLGVNPPQDEAVGFWSERSKSFD